MLWGVRSGSGGYPRQRVWKILAACFVGTRLRISGAPQWAESVWWVFAACFGGSRCEFSFSESPRSVFSGVTMTCFRGSSLRVGIIGNKILGWDGFRARKTLDFRCCNWFSGFHVGFLSSRHFGSLGKKLGTSRKHQGSGEGSALCLRSLWK